MFSSVGASLLSNTSPSILVPTEVNLLIKGGEQIYVEVIVSDLFDKNGDRAGHLALSEILRSEERSKSDSATHNNWKA